MTDFLGRELNIGDTVVAAIGHGKNSWASLTTGVVSKIMIICTKHTMGAKRQRN